MCFRCFFCLFHAISMNSSRLFEKIQIHCKYIQVCFMHTLKSWLTLLWTCSSLSLSLTPSQLGQIILLLEHAPLLYFSQSSNYSTKYFFYNMYKCTIFFGLLVDISYIILWDRSWYFYLMHFIWYLVIWSLLLLVKKMLPFAPVVQLALVIFIF